MKSNFAITFALAFLISCIILTNGRHVPASISEDAIFQTFSPYRNTIKAWFSGLTKHSHDVHRPRAEYVTCDVCVAAYPIIVENLENGATTEEIVEYIIKLCVALGIQEPEICDPTVRAYAIPVLYIIQNRPEMGRDDLCGILNPGCTPVNETFTNWEVQINDQKPPIQVLPELPSDVETSKILQFSDIHLNVNCTSVIGEGSGKQRSERQDYPCELPTSAYDAILDHARTTHGDAKFVVVTGDYVHSAIWTYSEEENSKNIGQVMEKLAAAFPETPVYPMTGNHEPNVVNMYPPKEIWDDFDLSWMYDVMVEPFEGKWLGPEQLATFKTGGFYTVKPEPGLRLVILNTNICYLNNFWLAFDPVDPAGQLQWFADTMLQAETDGDSVYLFSHIPPGSADCWPVWSDWFDRIVNRFEGSIRAQFYGHQHSDKFKLTFERDTDRPTSVSFVGPSLATEGENAGYKVYLVDGGRGPESTWEIADHETWILNISIPNSGNEFVFEKLYVAREEYGLASNRPDDLYDFVQRMVTDDALFLKFQRNVHKGRTLGSPCDPSSEEFQACKMELLCECVTAYSGSNYNCEILQQI